MGPINQANGMEPGKSKSERDQRGAAFRESGILDTIDVSTFGEEFLGLSGQGIGAHGLRNRKPLLCLRAALLGIHNGIAVRGLRSVPESLPRVFLHRTQGMLCVFLRLVFVEESEHLPDHDAHRVVAKVPRDA